MRRSDALVFLALAGSPVLLLAGFLLISVHVLGFGWTPPDPPRGTLEAGDERRRGVATVGCWTEKRALLPDRRACLGSEAGAIYKNGRQVEALTVSRGDAMLFAYEGASTPRRVEVRVARQGVPLDLELAERQDRMMREREGVHFPTPGTRVETVPAERVDGGAEVAAEMDPGRYLLIVSAKIEDETACGEAFYDFNVVVR